MAPRLTFAMLANRTWIQEPEVALLPLLSDSDRIAVDAGANKGVYLYHLCRHFQRVVAFEPLPQMARFLEVAKPRNATVHGLALSNAAGEALISLPRGFNELASLERTSGSGDEGVDIETHATRLRTLDSFELESVGLIKIDVEGHELAVIEGARGTLERNRPTVLVEVEERHKAGGIARVRAALEALGYEGYYLDGARLLPVALFDPARDQNPQSLENSVKVSRYINNFIYFERRQAAARVAAINRHLALPRAARSEDLRRLGSEGIVPAWHNLLAPDGVVARRRQMQRAA